ncbi:MAG: hypothetical protein H0U21_06450, partial [Acidimicrobiia bacterium]|nr:hypothetical protein [Acidimicrobiia bacterium]
MIAFLTRPAPDDLRWSIVLIGITALLLWRTSVSTRPPRLVPATASAELGAESPAIASLLT